MNKNFKLGVYYGADNGSARAVLQYSLDGEFIREWDYIKLAAETLNISRSGIGKCCQGLRKSAGNFRWKYKNV